MMVTIYNESHLFWLFIIYISISNGELCESKEGESNQTILRNQLSRVQSGRIEESEKCSFQ